MHRNRRRMNLTGNFLRERRKFSNCSLQNYWQLVSLRVLCAIFNIAEKFHIGSSHRFHGSYRPGLADHKQRVPLSYFAIRFAEISYSVRLIEKSSLNREKILPARKATDELDSAA